MTINNAIILNSVLKNSSISGTLWLRMKHEMYLHIKRQETTAVTTTYRKNADTVVSSSEEHFYENTDIISQLSVSASPTFGRGNTGVTPVCLRVDLTFLIFLPDRIRKFLDAAVGLHVGSVWGR